MIKINLVTKAEQQQLDALRSAHQFYVDNYMVPIRNEPMEPLRFTGWVPLTFFHVIYDNSYDNLLRVMLRKVYQKDKHYYYSDEYVVQTQDLIFIRSEARPMYEDKIFYVLYFECPISKLEDASEHYTKSNLFAEYHNKMLEEYSMPIRKPLPAAWFTGAERAVHVNYKPVIN